MSLSFKRLFCAQFIHAKISNILFRTTLAFGLLSGVLSAANVYYVSGQNGNDSWSGLLSSPNSSNTDGPFRTISKAQAAMQGSSIKTVNLRAGTYSISSTFRLYATDSGETWAAYTGESPILDGGGSGQFILNNPSNLTIEGLTFQNMGGGGLYINYGHVITLHSNNFYNCNQYCITGNGVLNSVIDSNIINGGASNSAISFWYGSSNNEITHNLIENCLGGGVNFATGATDPPSSNNIVDRNIFENVANSGAFDTGAIYMTDVSHTAVGNQITNNIIDGVGGAGYATNWTKAYYLDDLMSNVLVSGNVCRSCGEYGYQIHAGDHNTIVNNIFDLSTPGTILGLYQTEPSNGTRSDFGMNGNVFQRNIIYFSGSAPWSLYQVNVIPSDALPADSNNIYYSATGASIPNGQTIVDSNPIYSNPQFSQPSTGNYSMPSSSPAYTVIGFQALATDQGPAGTNSSSSSTSAVQPTIVGAGLIGSGTSATTTVNFTTEGPTDWAHWGTLSLTRKSGVTPQVGMWSIIGTGPANYYTNDPRAVTFTDGTVPTSATVHDGIYVNGTNGFSFTVPASQTVHTVTVHVGGFYSSGTLRAHLSDGSAADFVDTTSVVNGQYDRNYTLNYAAASGGQTLIISWLCNTASGNVTLNGAALK